MCVRPFLSVTSCWIMRFRAAASTCPSWMILNTATPRTQHCGSYTHCRYTHTRQQHMHATGTPTASTQTHTHTLIVYDIILCWQHHYHPVVRQWAVHLRQGAPSEGSAALSTELSRRYDHLTLCVSWEEVLGCHMKHSLTRVDFLSRTPVELFNIYSVNDTTFNPPVALPTSKKKVNQSNKHSVCLWSWIFWFVFKLCRRVSGPFCDWSDAAGWWAAETSWQCPECCHGDGDGAGLQHSAHKMLNHTRIKITNQITDGCLWSESVNVTKVFFFLTF